MVPIFFCMFSVGGVAGAGFVFQEMCYPGVLLLPPGVFLCICGVFAIAYRREKRLARHGAENGGGALSSSLLASFLSPLFFFLSPLLLGFARNPSWEDRDLYPHAPENCSGV